MFQSGMLATVFQLQIFLIFLPHLAALLPARLPLQPLHQVQALVLAAEGEAVAGKIYG